MGTYLWHWLPHRYLGSDCWKVFGAEHLNALLPEKSSQRNLIMLAHCHVLEAILQCEGARQGQGHLYLAREEAGRNNLNGN